MMGRHVRELVRFLYNSEQGLQALHKYEQMQQHEGWNVHTDTMIMLKGMILQDMIGRTFTELPPTEKDVRQRAYVGVIEVLDFLINPSAKARNQNDISNHNRKMGATVTGATEGETT